MAADDGTRFTHKETGKKIYHFVSSLLVFFGIVRDSVMIHAFHLHFQVVKFGENEDWHFCKQFCKQTHIRCRNMQLNVIHMLLNSEPISSCKHTNDVLWTYFSIALLLFEILLPCSSQQHALSWSISSPLFVLRLHRSLSHSKVSMHLNLNFTCRWARPHLQSTQSFMMWVWPKSQKKRPLIKFVF